jgi:competence protein ComEC
VRGEVELLLELADGRRARVRLPPLDGASACPAGQGAAALLPGDVVRLKTILATPWGPADPGVDDPGLRLAAEGTSWTARAPGGCDGIARRGVGTNGHPILRLAGRARAAAEAALHTDLGGDRLGLVQAACLGDRSDLDPAAADAFRQAGLLHLLHVSGLQLAVVAYGLYRSLRFLLRRSAWLTMRVNVARWAAALTTCPIAAYALCVADGPSAWRAAVVALVALAGAALGRRVDAASAVACSALALFVPSPLLLADPAVQMSFAAMVGIGCLAPRMLPQGMSTRARSWPGRLLRMACFTVAASAAAVVATAPVAALHFHDLTLGGLVGGLLVMPLIVLVVLPLGLVGACVGVVAPALAEPVLHLAGAAAELSLKTTLVLAGHLPAVLVAAPPLACVVLFYLAVTLIAARAETARGRRILRGLAAASALACVAGMAAVFVQHRVAPALRVTFLDVGQGDSAIVELPNGQAWVVDGGGSFDPADDPGTRILVPALAALGHTSVTRVYLSHPHPDHMNGLVSLFARFHPAGFYDAGGDTDDPAYARLLDAVQADGVPHLAPASEVVDGVRVEVLAPLRQDGQVERDPLDDPNDNSVVLRLSYGGHTVLLTGDVEAEAEAALLQRDPQAVRADVLKVPHHGSRTSSTLAFLHAVRPRLAVISCGNANHYGFPHAEVVARYRAQGVPILRTDLDGAVTVTLSADGSLDVTTFRDGELPPGFWRGPACARLHAWRSPSP